MNETENENTNSRIFLGVDGGQSHTEALIADENGNIRGRGLGGASNHAEHPGGRARLRNAIINSVGEALKTANLPELNETIFAAAHFGMTGGADFKEEIIGELVRAEHFAVGHDAPTALFGATSGKPGIVVIAGTGSVVYGINGRGETAQIGGLGYLFSDEGSGFWLALQTIRLAIKEQDGLIEKSGLEKLVLDFFKRRKLREITNDFYFDKMSRDDLASLAKVAHEAALNGNEIIADQIKFGANVLAESVCSAARRLNMNAEFSVAGVGGMFRGALLQRYFAEIMRERNSAAVFTAPRFNPAIGALLLAYRETEIEINTDLLNNLEKAQKDMNKIIESWRGGLIVSCQAPANSPLAKPQIIAAFAETAEQNGAIGVRIDSPAHISAVKQRVKLPILGIYKIVAGASEVYITPTFDAAEEIIRAGSDVIALDATLRPRPNDEKLENIVKQIRDRFDTPIMADVATFREGLNAAEFVGADVISTTLSGYTFETKSIVEPDFALVENLAKKVKVPIVCEGRLRSAEDVKRAFDCGAFAVVVGGAITGIDQLVHRFVSATPTNTEKFDYA